MGAFSKLVLLAVTAEGARRGEKKSLFGGAVRTGVQAFLGVVGAHSFSRMPEVGTPEFEMKHAQHMSELEHLLNNETAMKARYQEFMIKKYGSGCDGETCTVYQVGESDPKYLTFQYNVALAQARNKASNGKVIHGINNLLDLTRAEFKQRLGYRADMRPARSPQEIETLKASIKKKSTTVKTSKDWTDTALTPSKDQGQCGSCWAFSTVESMESAAILQDDMPYSVDEPFIGSPQELVSCDNKGDDEGCNGGLPENGFKWFKKHALESEDDYPYKSGTSGKTGKCKADYSEGKIKVDSTQALSIMGLGEDTDMKDYIMETGPMSIAVAANDAWQTYVGGVLDITDCPDKDVNHAVQAVGLNTDSDEPYWTVRNTWGEDWGEGGFIKVGYGENVCNIAADALGVTVKQVDDKKSGASSSSSGLSVKKSPQQVNV